MGKSTSPKSRGSIAAIRCFTASARSAKSSSASEPSQASLSANRSETERQKLTTSVSTLRKMYGHYRGRERTMAGEVAQGPARADEQEHPTARTDTDQTLVRPVGGSSRDSLAGAGWTCREAGKFRGLVSPRKKFSWLSLAPLWRSRNQILGSLFGDLTNDERRR